MGLERSHAKFTWAPLCIVNSPIGSVSLNAPNAIQLVASIVTSYRTKTYSFPTTSEQRSHDFTTTSAESSLHLLISTDLYLLAAVLCIVAASEVSPIGLIHSSRFFLLLRFRPFTPLPARAGCSSPNKFHESQVLAVPDLVNSSQNFEIAFSLFLGASTATS